MPDPNARQKAEDHYYAALDLMGDGQLEKAVAAYQESLAADPTFYRRLDDTEPGVPATADPGAMTPAHESGV